MISASARGAERMLSPAGSGSLDQPDRLQAVRPVVSMVAATAGAADRQETRERPNMKDRKLCLFIAISKRPFGFRDPPGTVRERKQLICVGLGVILVRTGLSRELRGPSPGLRYAQSDL